MTAGYVSQRVNGIILTLLRRLPFAREIFPMILVTGGAGFIGANFVLTGLAAVTSPCSTWTS